MVFRHSATRNGDTKATGTLVYEGVRALLKLDNKIKRLRAFAINCAAFLTINSKIIIFMANVTMCLVWHLYGNHK